MRRLGMLPWLVVWAVLSGLQVAAVFASLPAQGLISVALAAVLVVVLQALKWPVTVARLADLGRPSEDAILLFVPVASIGLSLSLFRGTPTDKARDKRRRSWKDRTLAPAAFLHGLRTLLSAPAVTIPALLAAGGFAALLDGVFLPLFREATDRASLGNGRWAPAGDTQVLVWQVLIGLVGLLVLYLIIQLFKRKKASWASWLPTTLTLPLFLVAVAFMPLLGDNFGPSQAPPGFFGTGLSLLWWVLGGGVLGTLFIALADDRRTHGTIDVGRALGAWRQRALGAVAVHGLTTTVVFIGLQALFVPGIVYAVIMGFTVHVAMLQPEHRPFARSRRLTRRWWRPVFLVLALGVVSGLVAQVGSIVLVDFVQVGLMGMDSPFLEPGESWSLQRTLAAWATMQAFPSSVPMPVGGMALGSFLGTLCSGAATAGLVWTYRERAERFDRLDQKIAEREAKKADDASEDDADD